jgi:hypothetical protein
MLSNVLTQVDEASSFSHHAHRSFNYVFGRSNERDYRTVVIRISVRAQDYRCRH